MVACLRTIGEELETDECVDEDKDESDQLRKKWWSGVMYQGIPLRDKFNRTNGEKDSKMCNP